MRDKYTIIMVVPGMRFQGDTLETSSLGGSETAAICMARELAKLGHSVRMFCECEKPGMYDGVLYVHISYAEHALQQMPADIAIVQRDPGPFKSSINARINLLWCHDLALGRVADTFRALSWNIDRFITVSNYMKTQYRKVYGLPDETVYASRNGIDLFRIPKVDLTKKLRKRLVYSARPERGLDVMLSSILPALLAKDPEFELALYGYNNPVEHMAAFYAGLKQQAAQFGDKVRFVGYLPKDELYKQYAESGIYAYPTPSPTSPTFTEVSCISIMESQACGMPVVTSARGALPETLHPDAGVLIDGDPWSDAYRDAFTGAVLRLAGDEEAYNRAALAGMAHSANLGWAGVAQEWSSWFDTLFDTFNDDPVRLAHHFYQRSDIGAVREVLGRLDNLDDGSPAANILLNKVQDEYAFTLGTERYRKHYLAAGKETDKRLSSVPLEAHAPMFENTGEQRFLNIQAFLEQHPELQNILEFGCGHGWSTVYFANKLGRSWTALDIDPGAIKWAKTFAEKFGRGNAEFEFVVGDQTAVPASKAPYDCLLISEVLEHCPDPYAVMDSLEQHIKPGGSVILTVPFGTSEYGTPNWDGFRGHIWEFDQHDLRDMFGSKPDFAMTSGVIYPNSVTGDMIGYYLVTYRADQKPTGRIDWDRKLRLQRPRQTISACIIAGREAELTLGWCLKSVQPYIDEIVIADTGMSGDAKAIAKKYGAKLVKGSDPTVSGFDVPRNEALAGCSMDWVLRIDTDEKLLGGMFLRKYLRQSVWHGLSIRQHHFAIDAGFSPDMPVRCFRRSPYPYEGGLKGKSMKFIGRIHEHPELDLNEGPGEVLILPDVNIAHIGYLDESIRRQRFIRNKPLLDMDRRDHPTRLLQKHFVMRDNMLLAQYQLQQSNGNVTTEVRALAEEVVQLYREHFLGKIKYTNIDSLQYYTQALQVLGRGIDVVFTVGANRDGKGDNLHNGQVPQPIVARFADYEEARIEIEYRLKERMMPLQAQEHW